MEYVPWILLGTLVLWVVVRQVAMARGRIGREEAHAKVEQGAVLLDVRTPGEFAGGHVEGAVNIPVQALGERLGELEKDRPLVVYCRSGARSHAAVKLLRDRGYDAHDLGPRHAWG